MWLDGLREEHELIIKENLPSLNRPKEQPNLTLEDSKEKVAQLLEKGIEYP